MAELVKGMQYQGTKRKIASWVNEVQSLARAAIVDRHLANYLSHLFAKLELPIQVLKVATKQEVVDSKAFEELEKSNVLMGPQHSIATSFNASS